MDTRQKLALAVPEIDDNFNPNLEPENGEEYLRKVIFERRCIPDVVKILPTNLKPRIIESTEVIIFNESRDLKRFFNIFLNF